MNQCKIRLKSLLDDLLYGNRRQTKNLAQKFLYSYHYQHFDTTDDPMTIFFEKNNTDISADYLSIY
jgi:hypothetical protein